MTNARDVALAVEYGADAVGFVLHPGSPRYVEPARALELARVVPPYVQRVAVTVDWELTRIQELAKQGGFDVWQLHGRETAAEVEALFPLRVVKAVGLPLEGEFDPVGFPAEAFLLDTASVSHGGTGESFDWKHALGFKEKTDKPCILAGGLNGKNIVRAIETVQPYGVDVCSGVEEAKGLKDPAKMKEFIELCRNCQKS